MTDAYDWRGRIGDAWAEEWRRTDRSLAPLEEALLAELRPRLAGIAAPAILDVGCGAGATCLALADAIPEARVIGIDLSERLIAVARERAGNRRNLDFAVADASAWTDPEGRRFDAIASRHGLMFFDDPIAAFANLRALAARQAALVFSCFRARADNEWAGAAFASIIARFAPEALAAPPPAAGPFAFDDPARIRHILNASGFPPPRIEAFDCDFVVGAGDDPVADAVSYFRRIGPFAALLAELDEAEAAAAVDQLAGILARKCRDGRVSYRAAAWIVSA